MGDNAARGDNTVLPDGDTGTDKHIGADPGTVLNRDGLANESERWVAPVMTSCAEQGALRDTDVVSERDRVQV